MRIHKIQFENFRNFLHTEVTLPAVPVTIIYDKNGTGKTSIHEGILWSLAGEIYRYNESKFKSEYGTIDALYSLRAKDNSRIQVRTEIQTVKGEKFVLDVNRPKRSKTYLTESQLKRGSDLMCEIQGKPFPLDAFRSQVNEVIGLDSRIVQTTNFLSQELVNESLVTDSKTRGNIFATMLSFGWMQELHATIKEEIDNLRNLIKSFQRQRELEDAKIRKSAIDKLWGSLMNKQKLIEQGGIKLHTPNQIGCIDFYLREKEISHLIGDFESEEKLSQEISNIDSEIPSKERITAGLHRVNTVIADLNQKLGSLQSTLLEDNSSDQFMEVYSQRSAISQNIRKYGDELKKIADRITELGDNIAEMKLKISSLTSSLDKWKVFSGKISALLEELPSNFSLGTLEAKVEEFKLRVDEEGAEISRLKGVYGEFSDELKKLEVLERELKSLSSEAERYSSISEEVVDAAISELIDLDISKFPEVSSALGQLKLAEDRSEVIQKLREMLNTIPVQYEKKKLVEQRSAIEKQKQLQDLSEEKRGLLNSMKQRLEVKKLKLSELENESDELEAEVRGIQEGRDLSKFLAFIGGALVISGVLLSVLVPSTLFLGIVLLIVGISSLIMYLRPAIALSLFGQHTILVPTEYKLGNHRAELNELLSKREVLSEELKSEEIRVNMLEIELQENSGVLSATQLSPEEIDELDRQYDNLVQITKSLELLSKSVVDLRHKVELTDNLERVGAEKKKLIEGMDAIILKVSQTPQALKEFVTELDERITLHDQRLKELENRRNNLQRYVQEYLKTEPEIQSVETAEEVEKRIAELSQKVLEDEKAVKLLGESQQSISKELGKKKAELTESEEYIRSVLQSYGLDPEILGMDQEAIKSLVTENREKSKLELKKLNDAIERINQIHDELKELQGFANTYYLLKDEWERSQEIYNQALENKDRLNNQITNAETLEKAWVKVNNTIKDNISGYSTAIIQDIEKDFIRYFEDLGGHESLSYWELNIKLVRNNVEVSLKVGENKKKLGSPKAVFSNGQQVCLILSLFFAMNKRVLTRYPLRYVGLDEPTQYLDSDRKADFAEFLDTYVSETDNPQVIITTADREFIEIIDEIGSDNVTVVDLEDLVSGSFSELQSTYVLDSVEKLDAKKLEPSVTEPLPSLITIPDSESQAKRPKPRKFKIYEEKQFSCKVCHMTFTDYFYRDICDNKECIRAQRELITPS